MIAARIATEVRIRNDVVEEIERLAPGGVCRNVNLSKVSRWKIGGVADCVVSPSTHDEIKSIVQFLRAIDVPFLPFGATSNLLFSDKGLHAVGICIGHRLSGIEIDGANFHVKGGTWVPLLARKVGLAGFCGIEHVCGIPGTVAGLVVMNGGSLRQSISENLVEVTTITTLGETLITPKKDCGFAYRTSHFQTNNQIITGVNFHFERREQTSSIRRHMLKILADRRSKFPQKMPNCGSVFKVNDEMYSEIGPPGAVLDRLGFKGRQIGAAQVSKEHANFINNIGGASANDVKNLANEMREAVLLATGYTLVPEAYFVEPCGSVLPLI